MDNTSNYFWLLSNEITGHISGAVLQAVLIVIDSLVFVFFFKKADKRKFQAQMQNAEKAKA